MKTVDKHYGHLAHDSEEHLRGLLAAQGECGEEEQSGGGWTRVSLRVNAREVAEPD